MVEEYEYADKRTYERVHNLHVYKYAKIHKKSGKPWDATISTITIISP